MTHVQYYVVFSLLYTLPIQSSQQLLHPVFIGGNLEDQHKVASKKQQSSSFLQEKFATQIHRGCHGIEAACCFLGLVSCMSCSMFCDECLKQKQCGDFCYDQGCACLAKGQECLQYAKQGSAKKKHKKFEMS